MAGNALFCGGEARVRGYAALLLFACLPVSVPAGSGWPVEIEQARHAESQSVIHHPSAQAGAAARAITQQLYIKAAFPDVSDFFGQSVDLDGDTLVVGMPGDSSSSVGTNGNQSDNSAPQAGAVFVYVRNSNGWALQAYIKSSNPDGGDVFGSPGDKFGTSVSISGDTLVVGAPEEESKASGINGDQSDNSIQNAGAAYVFVRNGDNWSQQAYLKASNTPQQYPNFNTFYFGQDVVVDGDTIAVGAIGEDSTSSGINGSESYEVAGTPGDNPNTGAVYVFVRNGTSWSQQAYIKASNPTAAGTIGGGGAQFQLLGDNFGGVLDLSGDTLVVGVENESSNATGINGDQSDNSAPFSGAVYVFVRNGDDWSQQAYVKASNTGKNDSFGHSVDIEGDTLAVGAYRETSNATGVNGDQSNDTVGFAGAVYVFSRSGNTWSQRAYIKSSNTDFSDQFGAAVALSGDRLAIGADGESSAATGVGGDQSNDGASGAGAVYLFRNSSGQWSQQAYIKASNTDAGDGFGKQVLLSGDLLVIGADLEDGGAGGMGADQADNSKLSAGAIYVFEGLEATEPGSAINQGMNDAWVSDQAPLQGMFFSVFENLGLFFMSWFTFDSNPAANSMGAVFGADDQRWITASGSFSGDTANLKAELTTGGAFDSANPLATQDTGYGTITIRFASCNSAIFTYSFADPGLSGQMNLTRALDDNVVICETMSKR